MGLQKILLEDLSRTDPQLLPQFAKEYRTDIHRLLSQGKIEEEQIDSAIEQSVLQRAKSDYTRLRKQEDIIYQLEDPAFLSYGIKKGDLSPDGLLGVLPFQNDQTISDFTERHYNPELPQHLKTKYFGL